MKLIMKRLSEGEFGKLIFFLFATLGTALVFTLTPELFPSTLISMILFFIFSPLVNFIERRGIRRIFAILAVFLFCGFIVGFVVSWGMPRITHEVETFEQGSAKYLSGFQEKLKTKEAHVLGRYPYFKNLNFSDRFVQWLQNSGTKVLKILPNLASHLIIAIFLVPFLTLVLLKDGREIRKAMLRLVPNQYFETVYSLMSRILAEMGGYVAARIFEALLISVIVSVCCMVLRIPYAILLGIFVGATNPIPYLGPLLGAAPGIIFAILDPTIPNQLFYVGLIYLFANVLDMVLIFPLLVAKIVNLHPLIVIVSVFLGSQVFGILGMVLAVPVTSFLKILTQEIYTRLYGNGFNEKFFM